MGSEYKRIPDSLMQLHSVHRLTHERSTDNSHFFGVQGDQFRVKHVSLVRISPTIDGPSYFHHQTRAAWEASCENRAWNRHVPMKPCHRQSNHAWMAPKRTENLLGNQRGSLSTTLGGVCSWQIRRRPRAPIPLHTFSSLSTSS